MIHRIFRNKRLADVLFVLAFLIFTGVTLSSLTSLKKSKKDVDLIQHTYAVMLTTEGVISSVKDAETASRAFAITGNRFFKEELHQAKANTVSRLANLNELTRDNPSQSPRVGRFIATIEEKLRVADTLVLEKETGEEFDQTRIVNRSRFLMTLIKTQAKKIKDEELHLLQLRTTSFSSSYNEIGSLEILGLVLGLGMIMGAYSLFRKQNQTIGLVLEKESALNAELKSSQANLKTQVAEQTKELREANDLLNRNSLAQRKDLERKNRELSDARLFQSSILPKVDMDLPNWEFGFSMVPANEVGGDYIDIKVKKNVPGIKIAFGDAAGHGLLAAMIVSNVRSLFNTLGESHTSPDLFQSISENLLSLRIRSAFMALAILDFKDGSMEVTSAGMPPFFIYRKQTGQIEEVTIRSLFLGSSFHVVYDTLTFSFEKGDLLLAVSDGVIEARNRSGHMFGVEKLHNTLLQLVQLPTQRISETIHKEVMSFTGLSQPLDDVSIIAIRMKE